jgi:CRISPR-associated endonuclease/helicase Cas3
MMIHFEHNLDDINDIINDILKSDKRNKFLLAAPYQSFLEHINNMLQAYEKNKATMRPAKKFIDRDLWDKIVKTTIIFHDIGKLNAFFQFKMITKRNDRQSYFSSLPASPIIKDLQYNKYPKRFSYHVIKSAILAYYFLKNHVLTNGLNPERKHMMIKIVANAILTHHSSQLELTKRIPFLSRYKMNYSQGDESDLWDLFWTYLKLADIIAEIKPLAKDDDLSNSLNDLNNFINTGDLKSEVKKIVKELLDDKIELDEKTNKDYFYLTHYLSSILFDLDEWDANANRQRKKEKKKDITFDCERELTRQEIIDEYICQNASESPLNPIRSEFLENTRALVSEIDIDKNRIFRMIAPTGAGKTLNLLSIAIYIKKAINSKFGFTPKIIYTLPFISICDQVEDVLQKLLNVQSQTTKLTVHHYLSQFAKKRNDEAIERAESNQELIPYEIALWRSDFIVTTTVKVFNTIFHYYKNSVKRFHRLCNSIIIIDEYHSIPVKYHDLFHIILEVLSQNFNIYFLLATATTPAILKEKDCLDVTEMDLFQGLNRYWINWIREPKTWEDFCDYTLSRIEEDLNQNIMIVVNTRNHAQQLYLFLVEELIKNEKINQDNLLHLSGNMIPVHRQNLIQNEILPKIKDQKGTILVSTQLIEAGIDVDFDYIIREFAPFSSIIQTAGRCNRHKNISNEVDLPEITLIAIEKAPTPYDEVDLEVTINTLKKLRSINGEESRLTERFIREHYFIYATELREERRTSDLVKSYNDWCFYKFTNCFKLIDEKCQSPIVIIYPQENPLSSLELIEAVDKITDTKTIPGIVWNYSVKIPEKKANRIFNNIRKIDDEKICFYILDLHENENRGFYRDDIGLYIE